MEMELKRVHNLRGVSRYNMRKCKEMKDPCLVTQGNPLVRKTTEESAQCKMIQREKGHSQTGSVRNLREVMGNSEVTEVIVGLRVNGMGENEAIFWSKRLKFSVDKVRLLTG